ncbi:alpha-glucoside transport system permease protein [Arcanobacterium wilhelmae]|uniref:Alpha-glucoside transport system permease protein n=1 Tax=Arcanobacterium wilhelmae TaxID=1803177 RepID=A0ABT9NAP8_9ACTO|nr:carbohydrate ABC transporter permease [Arcanobacterium wilhelmae]MDP9800795.1 alpha-glucoside transport system permease protein [Arcanobacterium wilhelmae]WFN90172.1 carbohydrate ABC transporter permease [Arcanobacterium wilhelmae]
MGNETYAPASGKHLAPPAQPTASPAQPTPTAPAQPAKKPSLGYRIQRALSHSVVNVILLLVGAMWLLPTVGLFFQSVRSPQDNAQTGWWNIFAKPAQFTWENYQSILGSQSMVQSLINTVLIVVPSTLLVVLLGAMAGYALAWIEFPGRTAVLVMIVALMAVPLQVAFIPLAQLFGAIGIFGTRLAVILFHTAFGLPFAIFLMRNYFRAISEETFEAARLDGASEWRIFFQIALPLGMPALASLTIFQFLWSWNDMLVALIFAGPNDKPITVALAEQLRLFSANIDLLAAGAFISMVIPLVVFFAGQKYFVSALLQGSTK